MQVSCSLTAPWIPQTIPVQQVEWTESSSSLSPLPPLSTLTTLYPKPRPGSADPPSSSAHTPSCVAPLLSAPVLLVESQLMCPVVVLSVWPPCPILPQVKRWLFQNSLQFAYALTFCLAIESKLLSATQKVSWLLLMQHRRQSGFLQSGPATLSSLSLIPSLTLQGPTLWKGLYSSLSHPGCFALPWTPPWNALFHPGILVYANSSWHV